MPVQPASLANLQPAFSPGNQMARRSRDLDRAIRGLRKWSPAAVEHVSQLMSDPYAEPALRLRAAIAILDKTIPNAGQDALQLGAGRIASITVHIVDTPDADAQGSVGPVETIEATPEPGSDKPRIHFVTVEGRGDND